MDGDILLGAMPGSKPGKEPGIISRASGRFLKAAHEVTSRIEALAENSTIRYRLARGALVSAGFLAGYGLGVLPPEYQVEVAGELGLPKTIFTWGNIGASTIGSLPDSYALYLALNSDHLALSIAGTIILGLKIGSNVGSSLYRGYQARKNGRATYSYGGIFGLGSQMTFRAIPYLNERAREGVASWRRDIHNNNDTLA